MKEVIKMNEAYEGLIRNLQKVQTVRMGWRDLKPGAYDLQIVTARENVTAVIPVHVIEVCHKTYELLTEADAVLDGFADLKSLRAELKKWYPSIHDNSPVSLLKFNLIEEDFLS